MSLPAPRSGLAVTAASLNALLLREAVVRMFGRRAAFAWLLLEPALHIGFLVLVYTGLRVRHVAGMDAGWWVASGMLTFFLFQRTAWRSTQAIDANRALFTYRQVLPVDTVIARCLLEGIFMLLIAAVTVAALALLGSLRIELEDAGYLLAALGALWALAVGWALSMSVLVSTLPDIGPALSLTGTGMMLASGVMFPVGSLPTPWREWLFLNPIAHGVEGVRASASVFYHHAPELSLSYLALWALALVFIGLALQVRFQAKVLSQ